MMKKSILSIGKVLKRKEQQIINGGGRPCEFFCPSVLSPGDYCRTDDCGFGQCNQDMICELVI